MKHLSIIFCFFSFVGYSQVGRIYDLNEYNQPEVGSIYVQFDDNYSDFWACIDFHDTMKTVFNTDTADFRNVLKILLPGTSGQYLRGDGVFTTFPTIPTNTNQLTNGAGFLTTFTEVDGSTTNEIELPTQTGNAGKYLTTNGSAPAWTAIKRQETYSGTTNGSGQYTVTFGTSYSVAPNIQIQIVGGSANQVATCIVSTTGFTVTVSQRDTVTLLGSEVLLASTTVASGVNVDILITEK